nr:MAG TPA: hypothetical protein [Caudoviricetes sp.]DAQ70861.1 MAG TPA: hypothetical protein [Caudoviricetes sp.]
MRKKKSSNKAEMLNLITATINLIASIATLIIAIRYG